MQSNLQMNEFKYLYIVIDDYYGFPGTFNEEILLHTIIFHGEMTVTNIQDQNRIGVPRFQVDKTRLYKIKEIK